MSRATSAFKIRYHIIDWYQVFPTQWLAAWLVFKNAGQTGRISTIASLLWPCVGWTGMHQTIHSKTLLWRFHNPFTPENIYTTHLLHHLSHSWRPHVHPFSFYNFALQIPDPQPQHYFGWDIGEFPFRPQDRETGWDGEIFRESAFRRMFKYTEAINASIVSSPTVLHTLKRSDFKTFFDFRFVGLNELNDCAGSAGCPCWLWSSRVASHQATTLTASCGVRASTLRSHQESYTES